KPKNNEDDYYGPEHGYIFPLSLFKRRIPTDSREIIKQKLHDQRRRHAAIGGASDKSCASIGANRNAQLLSDETASLTFSTFSLISVTCGCTSLIKSCSARESFSIRAVISWSSSNVVS